MMSPLVHRAFATSIFALINLENRTAMSRLRASLTSACFMFLATVATQRIICTRGTQFGSLSQLNAKLINTIHCFEACISFLESFVFVVLLSMGRICVSGS